jgi:tetratricopeptide (TPR) repeat protein
MKKALLFIVIYSAIYNSNVTAKRIEQLGWVTEINSGQAAISGVQIDFVGAVTTTSDNDGIFKLVFNDKQFGQNIYLREIYKKGYEIVNEGDFRPATLSSDTKLKIVICRTGYLAKMRAQYYDISINALTRTHQEKINQLEKELEQENSNQEQLIQEIQNLNQLYQATQKQAKKLSDKFARTNFDDVSDLYKRAFEQFKLGKIDEAIEILEEKNLAAEAEKVIQEGKKIDVAKEQLSENRNRATSHKNEILKSLKLSAKLHEEKGEIEVADSLFLKIWNIDTTNYYTTLEYAEFYSRNKTTNKAIGWYEKTLNKADSIFQKIYLINRIGDIYFEQQNLIKATENYKLVIILCTGFQQQPTRHKEELITAYCGMGNIYQFMKEKRQAKKYYKEALKIGTQLYSETNKPKHKQLIISINIKLKGLT